jgi:hypothetical protein
VEEIALLEALVSEPDGVEFGWAIEQQFGVAGLGAETPAISDPRPSF